MAPHPDYVINVIIFSAVNNEGIKAEIFMSDVSFTLGVIVMLFGALCDVRQRAGATWSNVM